MERKKQTVEIAVAQIASLVGVRPLVDDALGRPVRDLFVGTSDPEAVLVIEKPTPAKIAEIQNAAAAGPLVVCANPAIGVSKSQLGTQFGGCYLRRPPRRSVGRRYIPSTSIS